MAQIEGNNPGSIGPARQRPSADSKAPVRSSDFNYYIHDSVASFRLQLCGELSEAEVPELSGCWRTAQTTLGDRQLVLDLRKLRAVDASSRQWIISMASEGALLLPETFSRDGLALDASGEEDVNLGLGARLLSWFRGTRIFPNPSSTQAP